MKRLFTSLIKLLHSEKEVDWLIMHKLSKETKPTKQFDFSFVDGKERPDEPFGTHQGFISLNSPKAVSNFRLEITRFANDMKKNQVALANLFIIICQTSYKAEDKGILHDEFCSAIGKRKSENVYQVLIDSLNNKYYSHSHHAKENPTTTNEWRNILRISFHPGGFSDPVLSTLRLVRKNRSLIIRYNHVEPMRPMIRSVLFGSFGFKILIPEAKQRDILDNDTELGFLAAYVAGDLDSDIVPSWLSRDLVSELILRNWQTIGAEFFEHTFGLSYLNKNPGKVQKKVANLIHSVLYPRLTTADSSSNFWIKSFRFPNDFIAVFSWIYERQIKFSEIPVQNLQRMIDEYLAELDRIIESVPTLLQSKNKDNPFQSFQVSEPKYEMALTHLLLLFLHSTKRQNDRLKATCLKFKLLFYGNHRTETIAMNFTENLLLVVLSAYKCNGFTEKDLLSIQRILRIIEETILVPYVHLIEREDEIWNANSLKKVFEYDAGTYMVSQMTIRIKDSSIADTYDGFFNAISDVKIAKWPFERPAS